MRSSRPETSKVAETRSDVSLLETHGLGPISRMPNGDRLLGFALACQKGTDRVPVDAFDHALV